MVVVYVLQRSSHVSIFLDNFAKFVFFSKIGKLNTSNHYFIVLFHEPSIGLYAMVKCHGKIVI
jgi:hypothetical protein